MPDFPCGGASFNQKHVAAEGVRGGCSRAVSLTALREDDNLNKGNHHTADITLEREWPMSFAS